MPEGDQKIETLEEEIKVLKGEVRRTLVDLRALLMREDSPLSEGSFGRRAALEDLVPGDDIQPNRRELSETVRQEALPTPAATPPPALPGPQQQNAPIPGTEFGGGGPAGMHPPQMGVPAGMPMVQPGYAPVAAPVVTPAPQSPEPGLAEQQLKMADQERRLAEQERRLAEQDRRALVKFCGNSLPGCL